MHFARSAPAPPMAPKYTPSYFFIASTTSGRRAPFPIIPLAPTEVVDAMKKYDGVYFGAIGGAGALLAKCIKKAELIAYEDLGAEALRKLYVEDMPLVVIIDSEGNNLYEEGRAEYLKEHAE